MQVAMSESSIHWLTFLGGMGVQALIAAFVYGKLTQTVTATSDGLKAERDDRKSEITRINREQDEQWKEINLSGRSIEKIKGKLGMNGA